MTPFIQGYVIGMGVAWITFCCAAVTYHTKADELYFKEVVKPWTIRFTPQK